GYPNSTKSKTAHGNRGILDFLVFERDLLVWIRGTQGIKHRIIVLRGGHAELSRFAGKIIADQSFIIALNESLFCPFIKFNCPIMRFGIFRPVQTPEVVNDVPTSDNKNAMIPKLP